MYDMFHVNYIPVKKNNLYNKFNKKYYYFITEKKLKERRYI